MGVDFPCYTPHPMHNPSIAPLPKCPPTLPQQAESQAAHGSSQSWGWHIASPVQPACRAFGPNWAGSVVAHGALSTASGNHVQPQALSCSHTLPGLLPALARCTLRVYHQLLPPLGWGRTCGRVAYTHPQTAHPIPLFCTQKLLFPLTSYTTRIM